MQEKWGEISLLAAEEFLDNTPGLFAQGDRAILFSRIAVFLPPWFVQRTVTVQIAQLKSVGTVIPVGIFDCERFVPYFAIQQEVDTKWI